MDLVITDAIAQLEMLMPPLPEMDSLYAAAIAGDADAIATLEMEVDTPDEDERTILHIESINGNTERVLFILRKFANKNLLVKLDNQEKTALTWAAYYGHTEVVEVLIDAARHLKPGRHTSFQAFLRHADTWLNTALHLAVEYGHTSTVKLLVEADPTGTYLQNRVGKTPMYLAVEEGYNNIAEMIFITCTAPSFDGPDGSTVVRVENLGQAENPGETLYKIVGKDGLYAAAISGDADAIAKLEMQADKLMNEYGGTILHAESREGNAEHVRFILREFASKNLLFKLGNQQETALTWAAYLGHIEVVEVLIHAARYLPLSANDNLRTSFQAFLRHADQDLGTALHAAVKEGHDSIVKLLVEADPSDTHIQNRAGKTPMYLAVEEGYNNIAEIIFTTCTAPSFDGPNGSTVVRVKNLDQDKSPSGTLFKIMDRLDVLYDAAIARDAVAIAKLEMEADRLNEHGETILHVESERGHTEHVRFILKEFANKNLLVKPSKYKHTALHLALYQGCNEVAEILIDAARHLPVTSFHTFLRQGDLDMDTALHAAVVNGNVAIVKLLVEADPNDRHIQNDEGKTPMYIAVEKGFNDIAEIISTTCTTPSLDGPNGSTVVCIKNEAKSYKIMDKDALYVDAIAGDADATAILEMKADRVNKDEQTILHAESREGNTEHVRFILREFASKNLLVKLDDQERTALTWAAYLGHTEVVEVLIEEARRWPHTYSANDNLITSFQDFLRHADKDSETALHVAVKEGHVDIAKLLVEADPSHRHSQNKKGKTPMFIAAKKGYNNIVKLICTTCTAPSLDGPGCSTALHAATKHLNHDIEVVNLLISAARQLPHSSYNDDSVTPFQAFLRQGDEDLNTALHIAVMQGNLDTAKLLVMADPTDKHIQNKQGKTPMYMAAENGYHDIVKLIYTVCTPPLNLHGPGGSTVLHAATKHLNNDIEVVNLLISAARHLPHSSDNDDSVTPFQAFLRQGDEDLNTALHIAVMQGNLATAKLLVEADPSDRHIQNKQGKTPMYMAAENGYHDIVKLICTSCTPPLNLDGPGGSTVLHAAVKNLDKAKKEDRDVIGIIINVVRSAGERKVRNADKSLLELFNKTAKDKCTVLELAVERNNVDVVELILTENPAYGLRIDRDLIGLVPLIYKAKEKDYRDIVKLLTECYEKETAISDGDMASLISAIRMRKRESVLSKLKANNAKELVTFADNLGWTALHHAAYHQFDSVIYAIVEAQKRFEHKFVYQNMVSTPFHVAAEKGHTSTVFLLMQLWPSSSSSYTDLDKNGRNILHMAALQSNKEMIEGILQYCPPEYKKKFVNGGDKNGNTPLHLLISRGCLVPKLLRYQGIDIRVQNKEKCTPGDMLYFEDHVIDDQVQIKIVLDGIQIDTTRDIFSSSVFSSERERKDAIFRKQAESMKLEKYAGIKEDADAIANCFSEAIAGYPISKAALELKADTLNESGETILHVESKRGDIKNVRFILEEFANKNLLVKLDRLKQTALHLAAHHGHTKVAEVLIDAAKRWNQSLFSRINESGSTVLQLAMERNNVDVVKLILQEDPIYQPAGGEIKRNGLMRLINEAIDKKYGDDIFQLLSGAYKDGIDDEHKGVLDLILGIKRRDEGSVSGYLKDGKWLVTFKEDNGWTPLHYAVYHEFDSILGAIIEAQEYVRHEFVYENTVITPFHVAVKYGYTSTMIRLMQSWPAPSSGVTADNSPYTAVDENGQNILHLAAVLDNKHLAAVDNKHLAADDYKAADNKKKMVQSILKYCPEEYKDKILKQQDTNGDTPLHLLISHGCFIPELIKHEELNTMARNKNKFTPWDMLYFKSDVVADQVRIKIALDDVQTNQLAWNLWPKSTEKKTDIFTSIVPESKRRIKDVIFEESEKLLMDAEHEQMKIELEVYKKRTNTQIIVAALITTVTFTVGFTMPGGLRQSGEVDEGLVLLSKKKAFTAFMVSDALALLLSTSSLFFYFLESLSEDPNQVWKLNTASTVFNIVSVLAMMLTFITGTYVVLSHSPAIAITVCVIGSLFFPLLIVLLIKTVIGRHKVKRNKY